LAILHSAQQQMPVLLKIF